MNETEHDIEEFVGHATNIIQALDEAMKSPRFSEAERATLARVRESHIEIAAAWTKTVRHTMEIDAVLFGNPDVMEEAIRRRLTPRQCAELAARLSP
jgi:hypothetical protein